MSEKLRLRLHDNKHGANRVTGSVKKVGSNKGIAAADKLRKREEAEERQKSRDKRSSGMQLILLDGRPGRSLKERSRLS